MATLSGGCSSRDRVSNPSEVSNTTRPTAATVDGSVPTAVTALDQGRLVTSTPIAPDSKGDEPRTRTGAVPPTKVVSHRFVFKESGTVAKVGLEAPKREVTQVWVLEVTGDSAEAAFRWRKETGSPAESATHEVATDGVVRFGSPLHPDLQGPSIANPQPAPAWIPVDLDPAFLRNGTAHGSRDETRQTVEWTVERIGEELIDIAGRNMPTIRFRRTTIETLEHPRQGVGRFEQTTEEWYSPELAVIVRSRGREVETASPILEYDVSFELELTAVHVPPASDN